MKDLKIIAVLISLILIILLVACGDLAKEPGLVKAMRINKQLYRVHLKHKDGFTLNTWFQEVEETDSTITLIRIKIIKNKSVWWSENGEPQLQGILFYKANLDSFSYVDISDSLKYYRSNDVNNPLRH